jgi:hypothetical protein
MRADFPVVLDACVLANFAVCDLLLRLAETPRLYLPKWSATILDEMQRTQKGRLGWDAEISDSMRGMMSQEFPEAMITGHEQFELLVDVNEKDRHVAAAAVRSNSEVIVTFNLRDFPAEALAKFDIVARHPSDFLMTLHGMEPAIVVQRLHEIAAKRKKTVEDVAIGLGRFVPAFITQVAESLGWDLNSGGGERYAKN